jgi:N-acetylmuramoyl-L-alanine amidase
MDVLKYNIIQMRVILILPFFLFTFFTVDAQNPFKLKTVVIDPGHGGKDPGAIGKYSREKDIVLSVALKLGEYINTSLPDVKVIYTRKSDVFVPLDERAEIANKNHADLFISIHANSIRDPKIIGTETFVLGLHRSQENLEVAKKENSVIILEDDYTTKYEGFDPNSPESYIIFELMQNAFLDQSIRIASMFEYQFSNRVGRYSRGVKQAGFLVLRKTAMPSVLVELGFISNTNEEAFMTTDEGQSYLASAIFRAFRDYKMEYEGNGVAVVERSVNPVEETTPKISQPNVVFRIQVAITRKASDPKPLVLKRFNDVWAYEEPNGYKYTTCVSNSFEEIKAHLVEVRKIVPDAFIVAFENNQKISIDKALKTLGTKR